VGLKRSASKKKMPVPSIKGKGVWMNAERLLHSLQVFSMSEHDYQFDTRITIQIDCHFASCLFVAPKTHFFSGTLHKLLTDGIAKIQVVPS
jgi:hypothetical protein